MEFPEKRINDYSEAHTTPETPLLTDLNRNTHLKVLMPNMLSGPLQGRLLAMLSQMIRPKYILEIGTYTGYSAICLAEGLQDNGKLITIDINEELEAMVREYFKKAGVENKVDFRVGNALDIVPEIDGELDLVFIDADKENYSNYFELVLPKLKVGGYIIADNVLWSGKVLDPTKNNDRETLALDAFNKKVQDDSRVENVLLPVRDGLMIVRKR